MFVGSHGVDPPAEEVRNIDNRECFMTVQIAANIVANVTCPRW